MRIWSGSLVVVLSVLAAACSEAGNTTSPEASGPGAEGPLGTGGAGIGAGGSLAAGAAGTAGAGGNVIAPGNQGTAGAGGQVADTGGGGNGGDAVMAGTPAIDQPGTGGGGAGATESGDAGEMEPAAGVGAGAGAGGQPAGGQPAGGSGVDNGGNHYVRGPDPTIDSATAEGPYTVESYSTGFTIGPNFPGGTIWYPTDAEAPFASVAIVPGFVSPRVLIEGWGPFLASHGIVTFTIDTNSVTDQPSQRSRALLNALDSLAAENTRDGSPLNGLLDNDRQAVGGHSMGGGGTLITVNENPHLKAGLAMCPWSPGTTFSRDSVPTLLFASSGDPLAGGQSQGFYRSIPSVTPKLLFEWGAGDHFMANAPAGAAGQVGRFGLSWMKVFLEGDERYRQFLEQMCDGCTDFQSNL